MLVRSYAVKNQLSVDDVLEALTQCRGQDWEVTTKLSKSQINFLNQTFGNSQPQLPQAKETLQLPVSKSSGGLTEDSQLYKTKSSEKLAASDKSELTLKSAQVQVRAIRKKRITETAQIEAIQDYQTFQDTYEETTRELVVNEVFNHLESQSKIREEFRSAQMLRAQKKVQQQQASDDVTTQLLDLWESDSCDFLNDVLKNI
ncbi:hypothetical protein ACWATR_37170 [Nostoc sp. UIC 10890]